MNERRAIETRSRINVIGTERTHDRLGRVISEREGVHIQQSSIMKLESGELVAFVTPSVSAMALQEAIDAGEVASELRRQLSKGQINAGPGMATTLGAPDQLTELFDCLQRSMVCVAFSYVALEVYANEGLSIHENTLLEHEVHGRDGKKKVKKPAKYWEEKGSTEDKFGVLLPQHMSVPSPKGKKVWEDFRTLQKARNEIVHPKSMLTNPRVSKQADVPKASVFYGFLSDDVLRYPRAAVNMILYFAVRSSMPNWLHEPMNRLGITTSEPLR